MRLARFFRDDTRQLLLTEIGGEYSAILGDRAVVSEFLHPFRRVWMQGEPTNFGSIKNLMERCGPLGYSLGVLRICDQRYRSYRVAWWPEPLGPSDFTPEQIVDLLLNTRYAHAGATRRKGALTRSDLEMLEAQIGVERLEWLFEMTVFNLATCMCSVGDLALSLLDHLATKSLGRPTFRLHCQYSLEGLEVEVKLPPRVERVTPGWTPPAESEQNRLERYLRRQQFRNLADAIKLLNLTDNCLVGTVMSAASMDHLISLANLKTSHYASVRDTIDSQDDGVKFKTFCCVRTGNTGSLTLTRSGELRTYGYALRILDRELLAVQALMRDGEPVRLWSNHPRKFQWTIGAATGAAGGNYGQFPFLSATVRCFKHQVRKDDRAGEVTSYNRCRALWRLTCSHGEFFFARFLPYFLLSLFVSTLAFAERLTNSSSSTCSRISNASKTSLCRTSLSCEPAFPRPFMALTCPPTVGFDMANSSIRSCKSSLANLPDCVLRRFFTLIAVIKASRATRIRPAHAAELCQNNANAKRSSDATASGHRVGIEIISGIGQQQRGTNSST
jgi:hypothetical protein